MERDRKENKDCVRDDAIAYSCALLRSTLRYYCIRIRLLLVKTKEKFEPFIFAAGAPHGAKPSTAVNMKGAERQTPN